METKIQKWGNSLGVRLPSEVAKRGGFVARSVVRVQKYAGKDIIENLPKPRLTIKDLVAKITDENKHEAVDWGEPRGQEVW